MIWCAWLMKCSVCICWCWLMVWGVRELVSWFWLVLWWWCSVCGVRVVGVICWVCCFLSNFVRMFILSCVVVVRCWLMWCCM